MNLCVVIGAGYFSSMTSSCSFRITRTTEDLAQTVSALSQRLVKLEQKQESLELLLRQRQVEPDPEEIAMLDGVDQLLLECKELLDGSEQLNEEDDSWSCDEDNIAA